MAGPDGVKDSRSIGQQQSRFQREEFRTAVRALLMTPLMSPVHEDFAAVRRHADALRDWFARETGWMLQVARASAPRAAVISPGFGAKARNTISPTVLGDSMIRRSAAVTSSSSGTCACCSGVIRSSSIARRPAARSSIA